MGHRWLPILVRPKGGSSNQMRPVQIRGHFCIAGVYDPIENEYWTGGSDDATVLVRGRQNEATAIRTPEDEEQPNDVSRQNGKGKCATESPVSIGQRSFAQEAFGSYTTRN